MEAFGRGIAQGLVLAGREAAAPSIAAKPPVKRSRRPRGHLSPSGATAPPSIQPQLFPKPDFDAEPPPEFELPKMTLAQMEAAVERLTKGSGPPPGYYSPEEADSSVPLS